MSRSIPAPLMSHLQGEVLTLATMCRIERLDGTALALTSCDRDLAFGGETYVAMDPVSASSVQTSEGDGIDNLSIVGVLSSDLITDTDLLAGVYDGATVELFQVNYQENPLVSRALLLTGTIGEITLSDGTYTAEVRALGQRLAQQVGEVTSPTCRVRQLGDSRCKVGLASVSVTAITNAPSAEVTTAAPHGLITGQKTYFSNIAGMPTVTETLRIVQLVVDATHFTITDDLTSAGTYTGGGSIGFQFTDSVATVESATTFTLTADLRVAGFYSYGRAKFLTGLNTGWQREIKEHTRISSVPRIILQEAFPYAIAPGDTVLLEAGCDRSLNVCQSRFRNVINIVSEPWIPGNDLITTRGRR
jgi:uncharacterized phage protein (TIGR02218 family)